MNTDIISVEEKPIKKIIIYELTRLSIKQIKSYSNGVILWCNGYLLLVTSLPDLDVVSAEIMKSNILHYLSVYYCKMETFPTTLNTDDNQEIKVEDHSDTDTIKSIVRFIIKKNNG